MKRIIMNAKGLVSGRGTYLSFANAPIASALSEEFPRDAENVASLELKMARLSRAEAQRKQKSRSLPDCD
jgi:hypothetical protein